MEGILAAKNDIVVEFIPEASSWLVDKTQQNRIGITLPECQGRKFRTRESGYRAKVQSVDSSHEGIAENCSGHHHCQGGIR